MRKKVFRCEITTFARFFQRSMNLQHRILALLLCVLVVQVGAGVVVAHHCCDAEVHHVHVAGASACASACHADHNPVGCCRSEGARVLLFQGKVLRTAFERVASPSLLPVMPHLCWPLGCERVGALVSCFAEALPYVKVGTRLALFCVLRI